MAEVDKVEKEKRVYQISLMLRRKSVNFILQFIAQNWGLEKRQAFNYIKEARKEWRKYFEKLKGDGIAYHIAQLRDLKDQAYSRKVFIGRGDNKEAITIADLGLVFEITKEEAKLMGIYPSEKHDVKVEGELKIIDAKRKLIDKVNSIITRTGEDKTSE